MPVGSHDEAAMGSHDRAMLAVMQSDRERWGDGSDGDYAQDGGVVTFNDGPKYYTNCTLTGNATFGPADEYFGTIYGTGTLNIEAGSVLQARWNAGTSGGAARAVTGNGNAGSDDSGVLGSYEEENRVSGAGAGGAGGGDGTRNGGNGGVGSWKAWWHLIRVHNRTNGGVGAGANGMDSTSPACNSVVDYKDRMLYVGSIGIGGGGGAFTDNGGGGQGGAGGGGGKAGGYMHLCFRHILVAAAGGINVNGEDGGDGDDGVAGGTDIAGGGAGAGGAGGGTLWVFCETIDNPANCQANGGSGGSGGAGAGGGAAGGNGGDGGNGMVALLVLAA